MRDRDVAVERVDGCNVNGTRCQEAVDQVHIPWSIARR